MQILCLLMLVLYKNVSACFDDFVYFNFIYIHIFPIHINFNLYIGTNETAILEKTTIYTR